MSGPWAYTLCAGAGLVAGTLNVVAGGGSFLTLPILLFLGVPASEANATNRVGVLAQNASATWSFQTYRVLDWRWARTVVAPVLFGCVLGTWAALAVPDVAFRRILASAMLALTAWTLWHDSRSVTQAESPPRESTRMIGFFGAGVYGGFLQAGVGFFFLALTTAAGMDLVRGNAVKVLLILLQTLVSLGMFVGAGYVDWPLGLALATGYVTGGIIGARTTVIKGHRWVRRTVTVTIILFAILLWLMN